jgi:hypothetical protein
MYSGFTPDDQPSVDRQDHDRFNALYAAGYRNLVPVIPPDAPLHPKSLYAKLLAKGSDPRGKAPGIKTPDGWAGLKNWHSRETSQTDLLNWHAMGASTGIRTGAGLILIDADTTNLDFARIIRNKVEQHFGITPCRIGRDPKAGYPLRIDGPFPYHAVKFGPPNAKGYQDKVEILAEGRQFVAFGTHPATGKPYQWPRPLPAYDQLPIITTDALHAFLDDLRVSLPDTAVERAGNGEAVNPASLVGDLEVVKAAVNALPNTPAHFQSRESYIAVGQAIRGALPDHPGEALAIFQDFAARWAPHAGDLDEDDLRTVAEVDWHKFGPSHSVGAPYLVDLATKLTGMSPWFDVQAAHAEEIRLAREKAGEISPKAFLNGDGRPRLPLTPIAELAARALEATDPPLMEGWLDQGAMSVLYGESNVGKSFVALRLSWAIAAGQAVAGCAVTRGRVVYVVAEGGRGVAKRVAALRAKCGEGADGWFDLIVSPVNLLDPRADMPVLLERLRAAGPVAFLVVDTLSRAMAGGDENASTDMGALVKNLDAVRAATGAHLMVVHHSGKDRAKGARGHSLLRAATDTEIEVEAGRMVATKQRDIESRAAIGFVLTGVTVGTDATGRGVASAVAELSRAEREGPAPMPEGPSVGPSTVDRIRAAAAEGTWLHHWRAGAAWFGNVVAAAEGLDPATDRKAIEAVIGEMIRARVIALETRITETRNKRQFVVLAAPEMGAFD